MADTRDLKSLAYKAYEFESRWRHQKQEVFFGKLPAFFRKPEIFTKNILTKLCSSDILQCG